MAMPTDPLDALRLPIVPIDPRPEFAATLLARVEARPGPLERQAATVRYFVTDLGPSVDFYCRLLDFEEELRPSPAFAMLYRGDLRLLLSVPGGEGVVHTLPDGTIPQPGGWNRMTLRVADLAATAEVLRRQGVQFRHDIQPGIAVRTLLIEDPSGNPVELIEPASGYHERKRS
jgi:catechol 2,3-dioxygenase-like lactoylglutathione lyase family enzyme